MFTVTVQDMQATRARDLVFDDNVYRIAPPPPSPILPLPDIPDASPPNKNKATMSTVQDMQATSAQDLVFDGNVYRITPPPPSRITSAELYLPDIPDTPSLPTNTAPLVSPVHKPCVTRVVVKKPPDDNEFCSLSNMFSLELFV
jgi:hypothetical protein